MEQALEMPTCEIMELGRIPTSTIRGLIEIFVYSKLTRCSQEHFTESVKDFMMQGMDRDAAYEKALHAAVLNEVIVEAIANKVEDTLALEKQE